MQKALLQEIAEARPSYVLFLPGDWLDSFVNGNNNMGLLKVRRSRPYITVDRRRPFVNLCRPERKPEMLLALKQPKHMNGSQNLKGLMSWGVSLRIFPTISPAF